MVSDNDMFKAAAAKPKGSTLRLGLNVSKKVSRVGDVFWPGKGSGGV